MHELREKLGIGSTLGPFLSIFVHPNIVTQPLPLYTIKEEGGTLDKMMVGQHLAMAMY
jgi:hypothetical protein